MPAIPADPDIDGYDSEDEELSILMGTVSFFFFIFVFYFILTT